jgi:hypothetical protein
MLGTFSAFLAVMVEQRSERGLSMAGFACGMPLLTRPAAVPGSFCPSDHPAFEAFGCFTPLNRSSSNTLSLKHFKAFHA